MTDSGDLYQSGLSCSKRLTLIPKSHRGLQAMTHLSFYIFFFPWRLANTIQINLQGEQQSNTPVYKYTTHPVLPTLHITDHKQSKQPRSILNDVAVITKHSSKLTVRGCFHGAYFCCQWRVGVENHSFTWLIVWTFLQTWKCMHFHWIYASLTRRSNQWGHYFIPLTSKSGTMFKMEFLKKKKKIEVQWLENK